MATVTITIQCGSEKQNQILANAIMIALEDDNINKVLDTLSGYSQAASENNIPHVWAEIYPDDNDDPDHEVNIEFED